MAITTKKTTKTTKVAPKKANLEVENLKNENTQLKVQIAELERIISQLQTGGPDEELVSADEVRKRLAGPMAVHPLVDKIVRESGLKAYLWG